MPLPNVFLFNPFTEAYIASGAAFTPVKHQVALAHDLANLPQFLCEPEDVVLTHQRPSVAFVQSLQNAGFPIPRFSELRNGRVHIEDPNIPAALNGLRPWAWGPDSIEALEPLFSRVTAVPCEQDRFFNARIAQLYSKAWSASFLRKVLAHVRDQTRNDAGWLCSEHETGSAVRSLEQALAIIEGIRARGHHRIVVKESLGLAGHNSIRLWEPEILPSHLRWMSSALEANRELVIEPWLDRECDFSIQLEMGASGLSICGYTGLINDLKGQYVANWAEPGFRSSLPSKVRELLGKGVSGRDIEDLYARILGLLEIELRQIGFQGPVGMDAFVYRTTAGQCRLKPIVEINPRYTMGRLAVELMRHAAEGGYGKLRIVSSAQARAEGFPNLASYAEALQKRHPVQMETGACPRIREGVVCLNDPATSKGYLAIFEVREHNS